MIKANGEIKLIAERKMSVMEMTLILYCGANSCLKLIYLSNHKTGGNWAGPSCEGSDGKRRCVACRIANGKHRVY